MLNVNTSSGLTTLNSISTNSISSGLYQQSYTSTPHSTQFTATKTSGIITGYSALGSATVYPITFAVPSTSWGVWIYTVSFVAVGLYPVGTITSTSYPQCVTVWNNVSGVASFPNSSAPTIVQNNTSLATFNWSLSGNTLQLGCTQNSGQAFNVVCNYEVMFCGTELDI